MKEITSATTIEIVAIVEGTNVIPEGWPERHPLYYRDPNSWVYLTSDGLRFYKENKAEVDLLIHTVYEPKVEAWAKKAAEHLLN